MFGILDSTDRACVRFKALGQVDAQDKGAARAFCC